jgi:DNA replication and repair protein RecF
MRLQSLQLEHFRSYESADIAFDGGNVHLLIGPNGSGKTNILEAISILSITRSCRGRDEQELPRWGSAHYRVTGLVRSDAGIEKRLEVVSEVTPRQRKATFINDVKTGLGSFVGFLPTITFLPQDLLLFSGPPAERRRFLDLLLSQVSPDYLQTLSGYQKILKQRNALLRRIAEGHPDDGMLTLWDRELSKRGSLLTLARLEMIETLNLTLAEEMASLGESWPDARLFYQRKGEAHTAVELEQDLFAQLTQNRERDLILLSTTSGPHREDWQAVAGGRELPTFASRGQERVAVLALLLLQVSYLELKRGEKPVLLLDDAFSELDDGHQAALLSALEGYQVIMTSTRVPPNAEGARIWKVESGKVVRETTMAIRDR